MAQPVVQEQMVAPLTHLEPVAVAVLGTRLAPEALAALAGFPAAAAPAVVAVPQ